MAWLCLGLSGLGMLFMVWRLTGSLGKIASTRRAVREHRRKMMLDARLCPDCGYNVRIVTDRCPECGGAMRQANDG